MIDDRRYTSAVIYSGGLDSGATLHYLYRTKKIDLHRTLLIFADYGQMSLAGEVKSIDLMRNFYYQTTGIMPSWHSINLGPLYAGFQNIQDSPFISDLFRNRQYSTSNENNTIPFRNYLIVMAAAACCEHAGIEKLYATLGYYDDGGIWDNTPQATALLKDFMRNVNALRISSQMPAINTRLEIEIPSYGKSRKEWVTEQIQHGFPYQYTWSCWYYKGWKYPHDSMPTEPCGKCKCCNSRASVLKYAGYQMQRHAKKG